MPNTMSIMGMVFVNVKKAGRARGKRVKGLKTYFNLRTHRTRYVLPGLLPSAFWAPSLEK